MLKRFFVGTTLALLGISFSTAAYADGLVNDFFSKRTVRAAYQEDAPDASTKPMPNGNNSMNNGNGHMMNGNGNGHMNNGNGNGNGHMMNGNGNGHMKNGNGAMQHKNGVEWHTDFKKAAEMAKKGNMPLLLYFTGSDWCGWCKKMDREIFDSPEFAQNAGSKYVFVMLDFPMNKRLPQDQAQQNADLKRKYGITGYPTVILLSPNETFIAETGYRPGGGKAYADFLKDLTSSSQ